MDPTWPPLRKVIMEQGTDAIMKVEPRLVTGGGRGLFATEKINPLETLVSIPGHLLLNAKTLSNLYPRRILPQNSSNDRIEATPLTSAQLISLHLYRWRRGVIDSVFGAYLDSLPSSFHDHPLTVIIMNKSRSSIIDSLPASVVNLLLSVEKRLMNDWGVISKTLKKFPKLLPPLDMELIRDRHLQMGDFLWAWLNVNTRCVYHDLGFQQSDDNMTMCPLLDFANHTPLQSLSITKDEFALCDGMAFSSSTHLKPGDEVHLRYGGHSNAVLFTEYGFVLPIDTRNAHTINGEMSVDFDVEELFKLCQDHATKSQLLKDWNYWGDWTLHVEDGVGRPSFRLLPTLRLFHVSLEPTPNRDLEFWENTLLGLADIVSAENESKVRDSIMALCRQIIGRSVVKVPLVQSKISTGQRRVGDGDEGYLQVLRMAKSLCEEERLIAELVEKSIVDGVQF